MRSGVLAACVLLLGTGFMLGAQRSIRHFVQHQATSSDTLRGQAWSMSATHLACIDVAKQAIRRATVVKLDFTSPVEHVGGTWSVRGVVLLKDAPGGLTQTPFLCRLSTTTDQFSVGEPDLIMGP